MHCGIKASGALDLAYIFVPDCVGSAVVLSQNAIRSVTLDHNETVFNTNPVKLMVINSGNANSVTGPIGKTHVTQTVATASQAFGCKPCEVGVASTGIIGAPLPIDCITNGLQSFSGNEKNGDACATAILTTDGKKNSRPQHHHSRENRSLLRHHQRLRYDCPQHGHHPGVYCDERVT